MENGYQTENGTTDFLEEVGKLNIYAQSIINDKIELFKLKAAEESVKTVSGVVHAVILATLSMIFLIFISVVVGLALGRMLEDYVLGFLIVCGFYGLLIVLYFAFRKVLVMNPLTKIIIQKIM
ncbi:MAG: phage holin family protein [Bacteroidota bacterium]